MAKFLCACGALIRTSGEIPNPQQWNLISDSRFGEFTGQVDAEDVYAAATHAFRCDACGRLWIFWQGYNAAPIEYAPVDDSTLD